VVVIQIENVGMDPEGEVDSGQSLQFFPSGKWI